MLIGGENTFTPTFLESRELYKSRDMRKDEQEHFDVFRGDGDRPLELV